MILFLGISWIVEVKVTAEIVCGLFEETIILNQKLKFQIIKPDSIGGYTDN